MSRKINNKNRPKRVNNPAPAPVAKEEQNLDRVEITLEELQQVRLFVGMPMYGGMCNGLTTKGLIELAMACQSHGIQFSTHYLFNESLIQRARNYIADEFMRSNCTHMLFIDADIGFKADDVIAMLAYSLKHPDCKDVVAAIYPRKTIAWEKVDKAAKSGIVSNPNQLEDYAGDFVFNFKEGTTEMKISQPAEVAETGTGFMLIPRHVFEKFDEAYPEYRFRPDHLRSAHFDGSREITAYFHCEIDKNTKRYLSEDYFFCRMISAIGLKTVILPWIELMHTGSYIYKGSVDRMAQLQLDLISSGVKDGSEGRV